MADKVTVLIEAILSDKKFQQGVKNMSAQGKKASGTITQGFNKIKGAAVIAAGVLTGVLAAAFKNAAKEAIDFEESVNKFNQTFKGVEKEADNVRKNLVDNFALSSKAATELLANTGDLLSGFGLVGQEGLKLAGDVNVLAADLASFANVPVEQASVAITKGLLGEREAMKLLGISILETDVQQRLLLKGQQNLTGTALKAARAQATLELATEQSKNAIGDFARSSDSSANTLKKIQAIASDVQIEIGQQLVASLKPTLTEFGKFIQTEEGIEAIQKGVKGVVTAFLILKSIVTTVFNSIQIAIDAVRISIDSIGNATAILKEKGIGGLKEAFVSLGKVSEENKNNLQKNVQDISNSWKGDAEKIKEIWKETNNTLLEVSSERAAAQKQLITENVENVRLSADEIKNIQGELAQFENSLDEQKIENQIVQLETLLQNLMQHNKQIVVEANKLEKIEAKIEELKTKKVQDEWKKRLDIAKFGTNSITAGIQALSDFQSSVTDLTTKDEEEATRKKAKFQRALFFVTKGAALAQTGINTAEAILKAYALFGPPPSPLGIAAAVTAISTGALQAGAIALKKPPDLPSFQRGIENFSGGFARINENNRGEVVRLPNGTDVLTNSASKDLLFSRGNRSQVQNVTNETVNTTNNTFNVEGIRDINEFRNELLRTEGRRAFI